MKLNETAEMLSGLAQFLDKFLKTDAAKDLRAVSDCLKEFGEDSTASFCQFVVKAKNGANAAPKRTVKDEAKIAELTRQIRDYLDRPHEFDYPAIRALGTQAGTLKVPELKELGESVGCPLTGTKPKMVDRLTHWLTNLKMGIDQSSFSLVGAGR